MKLNTIITGLALAVLAAPAMAAPPPRIGTVPTAPTMGSSSGAFKPYRPPMRVDSNRGGLDAYPKAPKPPGYIDPNRKPPKGVFGSGY